MAGTYLDGIIAAHRAAAAGDGRDLVELLKAADAMPPARGFARALATRSADRRLAVIAEVKRRSPSKGDLDVGLDPAVAARDYEVGGACCLSVLTDTAYFGGSPQDLACARDAVGVPVLRKDFTVCAADVADARLMGADAVLLIVAALAPQELVDLLALALRVGLDALVEVHDRTELDRALDAGATLIGVNQRDLTTFAVDPERAVRLAADIPPGVMAVAESGIGGPGDAERVAGAGYDAVLVGESLVRAPDRRAAVAALAAVAAVGGGRRPVPAPDVSQP